MKINLAVYIQNNGDGSSSVKFFNTEPEAEEFAKDHNERNCEDVYTVELEFSEEGRLLSSHRLT
jgi:hypothetical protein